MVEMKRRKKKIPLSGGASLHLEQVYIWSSDDAAFDVQRTTTFKMTTK